MAASRDRLRCVMTWDSTMCPAHRSAFPSRDSPLLMLLSRRPEKIRPSVDFTPAPALPRVTGDFARALRIAVVTEYYYPHLGGICEHVHFFTREARRLGHHVDIVTSNL